MREVQEGVLGCWGPRSCPMPLWRAQALGRGQMLLVASP